MEYKDQIIDEGFSSSESSGLTAAARGYLLEIAKWGKFLSIIGFIGIGIIVLVALFAGSFFATMMAQTGASGMGGGFLTVLYLLMAALYFMPVFYLYKYSSEAKNALLNNSDSGLESALSNLKSHYKFMGIFTLVILAFYALAFVIALVSGGIAAMF